MSRPLPWLAALASVLVAAAVVSAQPPGGTPDPQALQEPRQAPVTLTPTLTVTEEFNDNIFLDNRDREWDFITGFTPGLSLVLERRTYRLAAEYSFTAELYARHSELDHAFDRQSFSLDGFYKPAPELTLSLTEALVVDTNTSLVAREAVATGRDRAWGNTLTPGVAWQIDPLTSLRGGASWTVQRYDADELQDSDVYRAAVTFERSLTRRLAGTLGYDAGYFDIQREPTTWTHTPRAGVVFRATDTVTLALNAGPTFELRDGGDDRVTPAVTASYSQRLQFGSVSASYDRFVGTAGGVGGTTDNQAFGAQLQVTSLLRGLTLSVAPRYNIEESDDDRVDIRSFTLSLSAAYRLTAWMSAVAAYRFFHQRSDSTALTGLGLPIATDADQNRVWVGLQLGWPVRFD